MMELASLHTLARTEEGQALWLTYKLLHQGGRYGVLCYLEGVDLARRPHAAARMADLYPTRAQAERLMKALAAHGVMPEHLEDVVWEGCGSLLPA